MKLSIIINLITNFLPIYYLFQIIPITIMGGENLKKLGEKMVKRFEDLTFTDDFMFCKVMQNPD